MRSKGFTVEEEHTSDMPTVRSELEIPPSLHGCHTAIVDGYVVEGHVPVEDIERLLTERPEVIGISVPGMPIGSPGMEVAGAPDAPYDVVAFNKDGSTFSDHTREDDYCPEGVIAACAGGTKTTCRVVLPNYTSNQATIMGLCLFCR